MATGAGLSLVAALVGILYALGCAAWVLRQDRGAIALQRPYRAIKQAAHAFFRNQYLAIFAVGLLLTLLLCLLPRFGILTAFGFALGGVCSGLAGGIGMAVAVRANVRVAAASALGTAAGLKLAVRSGAVTGFLVGSLALGCVTGFYLLLGWLAHGRPVSFNPLLGLGFGASLISIFGRLGGGIFTKAADVGADLVGKLEQGIPEDDARNPASIADNVGDNVGDCAGMAADLFESYVVSLISALLLAVWSFPQVAGALQYPLALGAAGMAASLAGIQPVSSASGAGLSSAFLRCVLVASSAAVLAFYAVTAYLIGAQFPYTRLALFGSALAGLGVGVVLALATAYYTSIQYSPVQKIADASRWGHATNVITGLAVGMRAVLWPAVVVAVGIVVSYDLAGFYGLAVATCAMLSLTPLVVSVDAYGPVTDNAGGIIQMAHVTDASREVTDRLDAVGNTTKAITKAFAIGSAGLAALVLFAVFQTELARKGGVRGFAINDSNVLCGLILGACLPFLFSSYALEAVGRAAGRVVAEIRAEFEKKPGILAGSREPEYGRTVALITRHSIRAMVVPALIPVLAPLIVYLVWSLVGSTGAGMRVLAGMLIGAVVTGFLLAVYMCMGGAAWDNAKKYLEGSHSAASCVQAAITGDTVGDPFKDTAGPAINPMIKILNLVVLLMISLLL